MSRHCVDVAVDVMADVAADVATLKSCQDTLLMMSRHRSPDVTTFFGQCRDITAFAAQC